MSKFFRIISCIVAGVILSSYFAFAEDEPAAPVALAADADVGVPEKPAFHGSPVNYGVPATVEVLALGCQGWPVGETRAVLVGEQPAADRGDGILVFEAVEAGAHRLYVYAPGGTVSDTPLVISSAMAVVRCEVMLDMCVETELTAVTGVVRDGRGKAVKGARVAVAELFLETTTDNKGRYALEVPPGDWEIRAEGPLGACAAAVHADPPEEGGGGYRQEKTADLTLTPPAR